MLHRCFLVLLSIFFSSCQFFDTERISSEEIFEDEIKTINWRDVDRYPAFHNCPESLDKATQRDCFINTITSRLYQSIKEEHLIALREVLDTIQIDFEVNPNGDISISNISMDSLLHKEFPNLKHRLHMSIDSLQPTAPAYKRGIPVKTKFSLPVIIQTEDKSVD